MTYEEERHILLQAADVIQKHIGANACTKEIDEALWALCNMIHPEADAKQKTANRESFCSHIGLAGDRARED